jgi:hypothetical protein
MFRREVRQRDYYPLGDQSFNGSLLKVRERGEPLQPISESRMPELVLPREKFSARSAT